MDVHSKPAPYRIPILPDLPADLFWLKLLMLAALIGVIVWICTHAWIRLSVLKHGHPPVQILYIWEWLAGYRRKTPR